MRASKVHVLKLLAALIMIASLSGIFSLTASAGVGSVLDGSVTDRPHPRYRFSMERTLVISFPLAYLARIPQCIGPLKDQNQSLGCSPSAVQGERFP